MPYVKFIAGHTDTGAIRSYLERNGRALAFDYLNLDAPVLRGNLGELPEYGDFDWSAAMDGTRRDYGSNSDWGGKRARTFKHYIFSPDPSDDLDIESLRRLATAWAEQCFPDHEVAIVCHNDNAAHVLHAHVVVNNVNLATGKRLREDDPRALKKAAQELARKMGLSFFGDAPEGPRGNAKSDKSYRPRTKQRVYKRKAEAEIEAKGEYSWVGDIRSRVAIAKGIANSEQEFRSMLRGMGVEVSDNSPKARRRDWLYSLADYPTRRVSGEKMGLSFGKQAMQEAFAQGPVGMLSAKTAHEIASIARTATEIRDLEELCELQLRKCKESAQTRRRAREGDPVRIRFACTARESFSFGCGKAQADGTARRAQALGRKAVARRQPAGKGALCSAAKPEETRPGEAETTWSLRPSTKLAGSTSSTPRR